MLALKRLLWLDCLAGGVVALVTLSLGKVLAPLFGVPSSLLMFVGLANASYGAFSFSLARQTNPSLRLVKLLVLANALWLFVCVGMVLHVRAEATWLGQAYLLGEGAFVFALATVEARVLARTPARGVNEARKRATKTPAS